jgi:parallel beta-helix repeat protein
MKTLNQLEPRTPISDMPVVIAEPGSYYLTRSISVTGAVAGIIIDCSDVKLDLNGFALNGSAGTSDGILVRNVQHNITIRNGVTRNWGGTGIDASKAYESSLLNVTAFENMSNGLAVGGNSLVSGCGAYMNQGAGILAGTGVTVEESKARGNAQGGIIAGEASRIVECLTSNNGICGIGVGTYCSVKECLAAQNTGDGILVGSKCRVVDNNAGGNSAGAGIHVTGKHNRVENNNAVDNLFGILIDPSSGGGNLIVRNSASGNGTNYSLDTGNPYGELLEELNGGFSLVSPWANFGMAGEQ